MDKRKLCRAISGFLELAINALKTAKTIVPVGSDVEKEIDNARYAVEIAHQKIETILEL